jgi:hypothetical protein
VPKIPKRISDLAVKAIEDVASPAISRFGVGKDRNLAADVLAEAPRARGKQAKFRRRWKRELSTQRIGWVLNRKKY